MTNAKTCPQCGEVSPVLAAVCPRCERGFKTTAPPANQQNEPQTVIGSIPPNFGQPNYSQPGSNPPPNFGQQADYNQQANFQNNRASYQQPFFRQLPNNNQQSFNPSNYNQQPKKSKAIWWIGGILGVVLMGAIGVVVLGAVIVANSQSIEGTKWVAADGETMAFGTNGRFTGMTGNGKFTVNGNMRVTGNYIDLKFDDKSIPGTMYKWTINGNSLTLLNTANHQTTIYQRVEWNE